MSLLICTWIVLAGLSLISGFPMAAGLFLVFAGYVGLAERDNARRTTGSPCHKTERGV